jgi:hypothetical protein
MLKDMTIRALSIGLIALQGALLAAISLKFDHQLSSKPKRRA